MEIFMLKLMMQMSYFDNGWKQFYLNKKYKILKKVRSSMGFNCLTSNFFSEMQKAALIKNICLLISVLICITVHSHSLQFWRNCYFYLDKFIFEFPSLPPGVTLSRNYIPKTNLPQSPPQVPSPSHLFRNVAQLPDFPNGSVYVCGTVRVHATRPELNLGQQVRLPAASSAVPRSQVPRKYKSYTKRSVYGKKCSLRCLLSALPAVRF